MTCRWRLWRSPVLRKAWTVFWMAWALVAAFPASAWTMAAAPAPGPEQRLTSPGADGAAESRSAGQASLLSATEEARMTGGMMVPGDGLAPASPLSAQAHSVDHGPAPEHACCPDDQASAAEPAPVGGQASPTARAEHACQGCPHCPDGCAPACAVLPHPPAWLPPPCARLWRPKPGFHATDEVPVRLERPPQWA